MIDGAIITVITIVGIIIVISSASVYYCKLRHKSTSYIYTNLDI